MKYAMLMSWFVEAVGVAHVVFDALVFPRSICIRPLWLRVDSIHANRSFACGVQFTALKQTAR
jgi:hypothetical protein